MCRACGVYCCRLQSLARCYCIGSVVLPWDCRVKLLRHVCGASRSQIYWDTLDLRVQTQRSAELRSRYEMTGAFGSISPAIGDLHTMLLHHTPYLSLPIIQAARWGKLYMVVLCTLLPLCCWGNGGVTGNRYHMGDKGILVRGRLRCICDCLIWSSRGTRRSGCHFVSLYVAIIQRCCYGQGCVHPCSCFSLREIKPYQAVQAARRYRRVVGAELVLSFKRDPVARRT